MPVEWSFASDSLSLGGTGTYRIAEADAKRQTVTARAILEHLRDQPGIVLADEVGMGKTYVALAVVASVLAATRRGADPVIVMVPPGLAGKWQREWQQFKVNCTRHEAFAWMNGRDRFAASPTEFFKLLDDPRDRRARLIWLTTSCFAQGLGDGWMKLAFVRLARSRTKMDEEGKKRLYKWATSLTRLGRTGLTPELVERLMTTDPLHWKGILVSHSVLGEEDDDPVPLHLLRHADDPRLDWRPLIDVLHGEVPGRRGQVSTERLRDARVAFNEECQKLYWSWLACADWKASLLVLDEAHHAKNDTTRLASLFRSADLTALIERREENPPILWNKAERMLFLTATPFQLGHHELIRVLRSFAAVRWTGAAAPSKPRDHLLHALDTLEVRLNQNRLAGRRLDTLWGRLSAAHVGHSDSADPFAAVSRWWAMASSGDGEPLIEELKQAIHECRRTKGSTESDPQDTWSGLRTWVIRHNRATTLPREAGQAVISRRVQRLGRAILTSGDDANTSTAGLPIAGTSALPFLLAARAQTELATSSARARAYFAEGLSSSYEAFHHTRDERGDVSESEAAAEGEPANTGELETIVPLAWYEDHVAKLVPSSDKPMMCFEHPKLRAVVERAVALWLTGEKVLIFCFYRETAKALRDHLRREVDSAIARRAAERLGLPPDQSDEANDFLARVARRLSDRDSPFYAELSAMITREVDDEAFRVLGPWREQIVGAISAYLRSPAFIARYLPFDVPEMRAALREGETRPDVIRHGTDGLRRGFEHAPDGSGLTTRDRVRNFLRFTRELAERAAVPTVGEDEAEDSLVEQYLRAVTVYVDHERPPADDDDELHVRRGSRSYRTLPTVRMVYGQTRRDVRERLMLAFNSPLFPEILVSSSVLAEGVDLHRFCRYLIHHDLCWNPSTLEQRTGRLDRIACKAEVARRSIVVYEPFLAGSADEKMFRVVRDRERWFQVVMGQKFELDERTTEALASRVPLPPSIATELIFDLRRWRE